ncbi:hypothetical protein H9L39_06820, partial [Fusarium oxysporum f. sp. albedinis]
LPETQDTVHHNAHLMVYVLTLLLVSGGTEQTPRTIRGDSTLPRGQKPSCSALICNLRGPSQSGNSKHLLRIAHIVLIFTASTFLVHSEDRWDNIVHLRAKQGGPVPAHEDAAY